MRAGCGVRHFGRASEIYPRVKVESRFYVIYSEPKVRVAANIYFSLCISHCAKDFVLSSHVLLIGILGAQVFLVSVLFGGGNRHRPGNRFSVYRHTSFYRAWLHGTNRCCVFHKLEARPSSSKTIVTRSTGRPTLLRWSGAQPAGSPRAACTLPGSRLI